jgi:YD repeat-containing protein
MDEHGRRDGDYDGRNPDLPTDQVHSKFGKDGKLKSISSTEAVDKGEEKTTFDFDDHGKIKSRTTDGPTGKEVVQYNADGTPKSRRTAKPGSHKEEVGKVYPEDTVKVQYDAQGKPVSLTSINGDSTSNFSFDEKGNVTSRSIEVPSQNYQAQFDGTGRVTKEVTKDRDLQGHTTKLTTKDNDLTHIESYAPNGKLNSVEEWGAANDYHSLAENLADGSTLFKMDKEGVETVTVNRPDGTKIENKTFENMRTNIKTVTNPDGSSYGTATTPDGTTTFRTNADGFWDAIVKYRRTGMESYIHGGPNDNFVDKLMNGPIVSAPI